MFFVGESGQVQEAIDLFIQRWGSAGGTERANYQLSLTELCRLLDIPQLDPAGDDTVIMRMFLSAR